MYSLNMPVSKIRTKIRSEFEKHRYVNQLGVVDVLLFQSHSEFQVSQRPWSLWAGGEGKRGRMLTETSHAGNAELLEAAGACDEVFQDGGRCNGEAAEELHLRVLGGESWSSLRLTSKRFLADSDH
jgi:hypothetical protein